MDTFTSIIGYLILGIGILITIAWCINIRDKVRKEQVREKAMELSGFLMTASLVLIPLLHISPFHLLWMIPASYFLGLFSVLTPLKILWIFSSFYFSFWYIGVSNAGRKFYVDGEYEKAIEAYEEDLFKKPSSAELYFNLAQAYGKVGQHKKEIWAYQQSIKLNPKMAQSYYNLGNAYNDFGDKRKAIDSYNEAIRLKSDYLKAHYFICKTYAEIGDKENAIKELEIVKKIDSNSADELAPIIKAV
jgi:tetratricopeptide (TPR) repeat protein